MQLAPMELPALSPAPLVSVIVSNYNCKRFLAGCIDCVRNQTYPHVEIVVCDDGSTDGSLLELERLQADCPTLRVLAQPNGGQASAWNTAVKAARGDVLAFLDPDDRFVEQKLERVVEAFRSNPDAGICVHQWIVCDEDGSNQAALCPVLMEGGWLAEVALRRGGNVQWLPPTSGISLRREVAERIFPIPDTNRLCWPDGYVQGVGQFLTRFVAIDAVLMHYVAHDSNALLRQDLSRESLLMYLRVFEAQHAQIRDWLRTAVDPALATRLDLLDGLIYVEYSLAVQLLDGSASAKSTPSSVLLRKLPRTPRRWIWFGLFFLPPAHGRRLFLLWWSPAPWKRWGRRVSGVLGLRLKTPFVETTR